MYIANWHQADQHKWECAARNFGLQVLRKLQGHSSKARQAEGLCTSSTE